MMQKLNDRLDSHESNAKSISSRSKSPVRPALNAKKTAPQGARNISAQSTDRVTDQAYQNAARDKGDFGLLYRTLCRYVQLQHHIANWQMLPRSIQKQIDNVTNNISPPGADDEILGQIMHLGCVFAKNLKTEVRKFLEQQLVRVKEQLSSCNKNDVARAKELTCKYIAEKLNRLPRERRYKLVDEGASFVGTKNLTAPQSGAEGPLAMDTAAPWVQQRNAKRKAADSPPATVQTRNQFQALSTIEEAVERNDSDDDCDFVPSSIPIQPAKKRPAVKNKKPINNTRSQRYQNPKPNVYVYGGERDEWGIEGFLSDRNHYLLLGDENVQDATDVPTNLKVISLPGARIRHVARAIKDYQGDKPLHLAIQIGINNRDQSETDSSEEINDLSIALGCNSHVADFIVFGPSTSAVLNEATATRMQRLNENLNNKFDAEFVEPLSTDEVHVCADDRYRVKHTVDTVTNVIKQISNHIADKYVAEQARRDAAQGLSY
jgi:hypothetical protein